MMRKVGFAMMAVLLAPLGIVSQTMLATVALTLFAILHSRSMPYNQNALNKLELYSLIVSLFTLQGGLYLFACDVCSDATQQGITALIVLLNGVFIFVVVLALLRAAGLSGAKSEKRVTRGAACLAVLATCARGVLGVENE